MGTTKEDVADVIHRAYAKGHGVGREIGFREGVDAYQAARRGRTITMLLIAAAIGALFGMMVGGALAATAPCESALETREVGL